MESKFALLDFNEKDGWTYDISDDVREMLIQVGISTIIEDAIREGVFNKWMEEEDANSEGG